MQYRTLGKTGLTVSEIGLGGEWFNGLSQEESTAIVDTAVEKGINYLDVFMPQAPTRDHLGEALKGRRNQFIIQGTCVRFMRMDSTHGPGTSRKQGAPFRICWTGCKRITLMLA